MPAATNVAIMSVQIQGDIGGTGISRFHFVTASGSDPTQTDCNSALSALHGLYNACQNSLPSNVSISFNSDVELINVATAAPFLIVGASTIPSNVNGTDGGVYGAGLGARINWKTAQVEGRRFLRSATFIVPLGGGAYLHTGALDPTAVGNVATGAANYINAMTTASLVPVAYHRPKKGTTTGGAYGPIIAAFVPNTPAGLRSRRS